MWAITALLVLIVLSGCRREDNSIPDVESQDRIIATASLGESDSELVLTWFPVECETFDAVEVELDDDFVNLKIKVTVDVTTCPPGGFSQTTVDLGEPIGDRTIFDRAFNDTVALDG